MKIIASPRTFVTGAPLDPVELNTLYQYARDAVADVASKRWTKAPLLFPFCTDVGAPYTEASGELLSYRFTCPVTCVVERGFFHANMTSIGEVKVDITRVSDASTPTGCSVPWLSTKGAIDGTAVSTTGIIALATTDTQAINVDRFVLVAGAEYKITVSSSAAFSLQRFDVILHLAIDRWTLAGTTALPDFDPTLFTDASFVDATVIAANNTALSTQAALFASARTAPTPMLFVAHGFVSGTSVDLLRQTMPVFDPARARCAISRAYVYAVMGGTGGGTVTATVSNAAGASQVVASANVAGVLYASGDSGAVNRALEGAAGDPAVTASDWRLDLANSAAAVTCTRAHALVWAARSAT